ncbi:hypothetical protein FI667_g14397, partial [Globisporangium splendens]
MASSAADVGLDELQTRLETFTQQLESIHELLQSDPQNDEFLGIAQDLVEVIRLTKEMVPARSSFSDRRPSMRLDDWCGRVIDLKLTNAEEQLKTQQPPLESAKESSDMFEGSPAIWYVCCWLRPAIVDLKFSPGTICEAQSKGVWYPAYIESITSANTYNVHYLGFGNKDEVRESALREVVPSSGDGGQLPAKEAIDVGFQCEAKYYVDSQFYTCSVTEVTPYGFRVLFDGYGNSEEVPYEYLRPLTAVAASATASAAVGASSSVFSSSTGVASSSSSSSSPKKAPAKPFVAPIEKPIKIPENLQILPTDSEAEKERKRKRLRAIKSLNRHKTIDNERNMKQNAWKSFQHNAIKKKAKGTSGVLSKRGTSIFASPETVDGRVGVVGSGQGMTAFQDARKKLKPSHIPGPGQLH